MNVKRIGSTIKKRRLEAGLSLSELARMSGVDKGNLSRLENGTLGTSLPALERIAKALNLGLAELLNDVGNVSTVISGARKIPLLSWKQAGEPLHVRDLDGAMPEYALFNVAASPETFALRIEDESMSPRLNVGDIIAVDPKRPIRPGAFVIAQIGDAKFLRKYRELGHDKKGRPVFELVPLNTLFAPRRSDLEKIKIIGVAINVLQPL